MEVFDAPDTLLSLRAARAIDARAAGAGTAERQTSNELAAAFAERLLKERTTPRSASIYAWRLAAGRAADADEKALALKFLAEKPDDPAAVKEFALAVFNLNAFLVRELIWPNIFASPATAASF